MISSRCFTEEWLQAKRRELRAGDPGLLERAIHALALLGHLAESGLDFVFKGGTSLLIHVPVIRRLSIDIDILCSAPASDFNRVLTEIAAKPPFLRYEEDERGSRGLPHRRHFKFFYTPLIAGNPAPYIFLDVVEEARIPHDVVIKPIDLPFLEIDREVMVNVATIESLLADKLSAFAPHTTGVPLNPANGLSADTMQIVKQLFDIGELFSLAEDLDAVRRTYQRVFALENEYRGNAFQSEDALYDALNASLFLCRHRLRGVQDHPEALLLEDGARRLNSYLINHRFNLDDAKVAAAKTGLLCCRLLHDHNLNRTFADSRDMPDTDALRSLSISGKWEILNRLKATAPAAFYYWYLASRLAQPGD